MKKTLLTIAATVAITTSAQAMDAVGQAKMKNVVNTIAAPMLMPLEACGAKNYIDMYQSMYKLAHMAGGIPEGDMWSSVIDIEFSMMPINANAEVKGIVRQIKANVKGTEEFCTGLEEKAAKFIEDINS